jgi:hypothetical protein
LIVTKFSICACLVWAASLAIPAASSAQVFGQFTSAPTIPVNTRLFGGYLQSSSNVLGLLAQLRLSFYPDVDFGFQGGFARQSLESGDRTTLRLATDLKYQMLHATTAAPYSISVGGGLGVEAGDSWNVISLGPCVVGSRSFTGSDALGFTPFVSAGLLFTNINVESLNESDFSMPLRLGSELRMNSQITLTAELQFRVSDDFNDDTGFSVGVSSPF